MLLFSLLPGLAFKWSSFCYTLSLNWDHFPFSVWHSWFYGSLRDHLTIFLALAGPQKLMLTHWLWPNAYDFFVSPPWTSPFHDSSLALANKTRSLMEWVHILQPRLLSLALKSWSGKPPYAVSWTRMSSFFQKETFCTPIFQVKKCRRWDINILLQTTSKPICFSPSIWRVSLACFPEIFVQYIERISLSRDFVQ